MNNFARKERNDCSLSLFDDPKHNLVDLQKIITMEKQTSKGNGRKGKKNWDLENR